MQVAQEAAVEIDRLVITLNRRIGALHGPELRERAAAVGLESLDMLQHFEDWLITGRLTRELAQTRLLYRPASSVDARIEQLVELGLVATGPGGFVATPRLRPLLEAMLAVRVDVARTAWSRHAGDVDTVLRLGRKVVDAASEEHLVAVSHRSLPEPEDRCLRLEHRLFTLRYIRQHDHAAAWRSFDLTASQMVVFTRLWKGETPGPGDDLQALADTGLAIVDPPALTAQGLERREQIEVETNHRAQQSFGVLEESEAVRFLEALRRLPSAV